MGNPMRPLPWTSKGHVTGNEMASLNITGDTFHPEWNYAIAPKMSL